MPRRDLLQLRRGTAAQWVTANPVLAAAEAGFEIDTGKMKYGDGSTTWNSLDYFLPDATPDPETTLLGNPITALELGRLSGVTSSVQTQINGKAAASHAHPISDVTSLQAALDAKAATAHSHVIADSTGLQAALDGKAASAHTHAIADTTSLQATLDAKLPLAGGTMTGALTLSGAPSSDLHAATKAYIDTAIAAITVEPTYYNAKSNIGGASTELAGDDTGDDAVKLEALMLLVANAGGGRIFFPKGVYRFSRALQDTGVGGSNTQCQIPLIDDHANMVTIDLIGETTPPTQFYEVNVNPTGTNYSILKSTLTGASGTASMIGGKMHPSATWWNGVMLNFEKLVIQLPANPTLTAIDLRAQMGQRTEKVFIYDGTAREVNHNEPTNTNSFGLRLPPFSHSAYTYVEGLIVLGLYHGVELGERVEGSMNMYACKVALNVPQAYHASFFTLGMYGCPIGISCLGEHYIHIPLLDVQHDNGVGQAWQDAVADVNDPSNVLHGKATWITVDANVGNSHNLIKNGGTNFITTELV